MKELYQIAEVENVQLSLNYTLSKMKTMVLPVIGSFRGIGAVGILGGDAFAQSVITFDARKQIMVINYPYRPFEVNGWGRDVFWRYTSFYH